MFESMMEELREQLKNDISYFKKYGIKSAMLQRAMNQLKLDDEDVRRLSWVQNGILKSQEGLSIKIQLGN